MPRENSNKSFLAMLMESEERGDLPSTDLDSDEELAIQRHFIQIGVDPLGLPELKLTRQHATYLGQADELPSIDL